MKSGEVWICFSSYRKIEKGEKVKILDLAYVTPEGIKLKDCVVISIRLHPEYYGEYYFIERDIFVQHFEKDYLKNTNIKYEGN